MATPKPATLPKSPADICRILEEYADCYEELNDNESDTAFAESCCSHTNREESHYDY